MTDSLTPSAVWSVRPLRTGRNFNPGGGWAAITPGCPPRPHPHRDCECRIFRTIDEANAHIASHTNTLAEDQQS